MTVTELDKAQAEDYTAQEARLRRELAAVYRLIAHFKLTDLIYNHISVRLPGPEHRFLLNPYGLLYEEVTASNLVIVGLDGLLITDGPWKINPAGFVIHSAIHEAREDALCVLHTHTKAGCAVAAQSHGLLPLGASPGQAFLRMFYLERSCEIQVDALAGGAPIVTPPPDVCEHTARQFGGGQSEDDYSNDTAPNLAWDAMLRLVERLYPDYKD